jgi:hypothetical protein
MLCRQTNWHDQPSNHSDIQHNQFDVSHQILISQTYNHSISAILG